jgi:hypothetical protein
MVYIGFEIIEFQRVSSLPEEDLPGWFARITPSPATGNVRHYVEPSTYRTSYCGMASAWDLRPPEPGDEHIRRCSNCDKMLNTRRHPAH